MKLILQRTQGDPIVGPFWLESATLDSKLHGFLRLTHDQASYTEGRFAPNGDLYWISDQSGTPLAYHGDTPKTERHTLNIAFRSNGDLVSLQCQDEQSPCTINGTLQLDSSVTHFDRAGDQWVATTLERLYKGPLESLQDQGPTTIRSFTLDAEGHLWHTANATLYRNQELIYEANGNLDWPLWTPKGVLVTQYNQQKSRLLKIEDGHKTVLWSGESEWVRATSWKP